MTETGMSKTMFFGCLVGQQLANMAMAEEEPRHRMYMFFGLVMLIFIYWAKQTFLEFMKNIWLKYKGISDDPGPEQETG